MYNTEQLEGIIKCTYPSQVTTETQNKRLTNITAVQGMIGDAMQSKHLNYHVSEERLHIFTTQAGEKIYIQYPGKESALTGDKQRKYDFRPKIVTSDGQLLRDLVFADMWGLIEELTKQEARVLKLMAAIFFRLGRMMFHSEVDKEYPCESLDENGNIVGTSTRRLHWHEFHIDDDVMASLNFRAENLTVDDSITISLEAFLCFFELVLQNEDSKYYDKKGNLSSGRISTSDSMLLLSSALFGKIKLSTLLQRFVSGFGVARCAISEIDAATDGLVHIVDRRKELREYLDSNNITYRTGATITVNGQQNRVALKTDLPMVAILREADAVIEANLHGAGWNVFNFESLVDEAVYHALLSLYRGHQ